MDSCPSWACLSDLGGGQRPSRNASKAKMKRKFFRPPAARFCLTPQDFFFILALCQGEIGPVCEREGLPPRNIERRNGTGERPEWGASPAKPSKPLCCDQLQCSPGWYRCGVSWRFLRSRCWPFLFRNQDTLRLPDRRRRQRSEFLLD